MGVSGVRSQFLPLEPTFALGIQSLERGSVQAGQLVLDLVADLALQVAEMAIALRELRQESLVERQLCIGLDGIDAVFFIGEPAQHDAPAAFALFQKIVEPARTHDIAKHSVDLVALRDRHFSLRYCALAFDIDAHSAKHMHDAYAPVVAFLADADEVLVRTLKPGRPHLAVPMPDGPETIPHARIAPE